MSAKTSEELYKDICTDIFDGTDLKNEDIVYIDARKLTKKEIALEVKAGDLAILFDRVNKLSKKNIIKLSNNIYRDLITIDIDDIKTEANLWNEYCIQLTVLHIINNHLYETPINLIDSEYMKQEIKRLNLK
jgi:hypothetical protein